MTYPKTKFQKWLSKHHACIAARKWVAGKSLRTAWDECGDTYWMRWFCCAYFSHCSKHGAEIHEPLTVLVDNVASLQAYQIRSVVRLPESVLKRFDNPPRLSNKRRRKSRD